METIQFDSGIREFNLNGLGVLRFNPCDPNLYTRFMEAVDSLADLEKELSRQAKAASEDARGTTILKLLKDADRQMKQTLSHVFGEGNDFEVLLGGVNLLAVGNNGQRVITNLFAALQPVLLLGAEACARQQTDAAVRQAQARRAAQ